MNIDVLTRLKNAAIARWQSLQAMYEKATCEAALAAAELEEQVALHYRLEGEFDKATRNIVSATTLYSKSSESATAHRLIPEFLAQCESRLSTKSLRMLVGTQKNLFNQELHVERITE